MKALSVIISNRNDTSMLAVTVRSCIEELISFGKGNFEIIIVDNSEDEYRQLLKSCLPMGYEREGILRIINQDFPCLFSARETGIRAAKYEYVACVDSHMLIGHNMFVDLIDFIERHNGDHTLGFAHAPINWVHQHEGGARHDRDMNRSELGPWGSAYNYERTITWKGMPWVCRKDWFLSKDGLGGYGALAQHKISWGGGDMHIGVKPWLLGFRNWAVPTRPGIHIGPFPKIDIDKNPNMAKVDKHKYRLWSSSGNGPHAMGFIVSCYILGGDNMIQRNAGIIEERFGLSINKNGCYEQAKEWAKDEKAWLDDRKIMSFEELLERRPWDNAS